MRSRMRRSGQVEVEMILILPVFLGIIFTIMEIGYVSFRLIVLNHATYEVARVGGMTWLLPNGGPVRLSTLMTSILPEATVNCSEDKTLPDPQSGVQNTELRCTGSENVRLIFPISSIMLAKPAGTGKRLLTATVYMPVERPMSK